MDAEDYMRQACHTAHDYMLRAVSDIDSVFDEPGYAKKHPELVGAYIRTAAQDFHTCFKPEGGTADHLWMIAKALTPFEYMEGGIPEGIHNLAEAMRASARHLGTNDAATPMGALEHVAKELREGLGEVASALQYLKADE